eukprot:jgi/Botrbrau1/8852/Bobra.50_2s0011.1
MGYASVFSDRQMARYILPARCCCFHSQVRQKGVLRSTVYLAMLPLQLTGKMISRTRRYSRLSHGMTVEANELNKWANTDGFDDVDGEDDDGFDWDTSKIVLRVLTSRATQKVLCYLQETDLYVAHWLSDFVSKNPPLEGDKFILKLFQERALTTSDNINNTEHWISPPDLANRILTVRLDLAKRLSRGYPDFVKRTNLEVLRSHLEKNSYTSGTLPENARRRKQARDVR